jgi:SIR2-like domain
MQPVLLVGNGPNYFSRGFSWQYAIRVAAQRAGLSNQVEKLIDEPLPLVYETIASQYPHDEGETKRQLAEQLSVLQHDKIHEDLMSLGWPTVLTTNYDNALEAASGESFHSANLDSESTYSVFRRRCSKSHSVWHIHGEISGPRTMLLGFHQYAGYLQKLRQYLTTKNNGSPFTFASDTWKTDDDRHSWADIFLRNNVHIVGFGFDYAETVLWWLLSYKQRLSRVKEVTTGTTTYYQMGKVKKPDRRLELMMAFGVKVISISTSTGIPTRNSWSKVISMLKRVPKK